MGKKQQKSKKKKSTQGKSSSTNIISSKDGFIEVDPQRVRFQHSRIRPQFSGCGRSVVSTLDSIRKGDITPSDIPPIQVIVGPDENDGKGPWYFSLNNRRLWVFKRCRDEGLLPNNVIRVRVRQPKSTGEFERYSIDNCAVEAKFFRESERSHDTTHEQDGEKEKLSCNEKQISVKNLKINDNIDEKNDIGSHCHDIHEDNNAVNDEVDGKEEDSIKSGSESDEDEDHFQSSNKNRFCFGDESSDDETSADE